jgi:hypothetical protein
MTGVPGVLDMGFLAVSGSPVAIIKAMNGLRNGGLMSGQILVNPAVKSGVTQFSVDFFTI